MKQNITCIAATKEGNDEVSITEVSIRDLMYAHMHY